MIIMILTIRVAKIGQYHNCQTMMTERDRWAGIASKNAPHHTKHSAQSQQAHEDHVR